LTQQSDGIDASAAFVGRCGSLTAATTNLHGTFIISRSGPHDRCPILTIPQWGICTGVGRTVPCYEAPSQSERVERFAISTASYEVTDSTTSPPGPRAHAALLVATDIEKSYGRGVWPVRRRQLVLRGANLSLLPGEVVGLVGENRSGKSTLMKILVGADAADSGTVRRTGQVGYCPQQPLVYPRLTPDEHFELFAHAYRMSDEQALTFQGETAGCLARCEVGWRCLPGTLRRVRSGCGGRQSGPRVPACG
jgi:hypothetical protein